ncbi:MAG: cytochrome c oxidase subunit II [Chitinophagales bacterium]|nr:cytochrome c oxidase subunit II [Chitinophagales bacterium]
MGITLLLGLLALILLFYVLFRIARTSELASILRGDIHNYQYASKVNGVLMMAFLIIGLIMIVYSSMIYIPKMLPEAASVHGAKTDRLFNITLFFIGVVFVLTQIVLFYFSWKYREKEGRKAFFYSHNNMLEVVWTLIPAVVMTVLVVMGLQTWFSIFPSHDEMPEDRLEIEVTAKQFNWIVRYAGMDGEFGPRMIDTNYISQTNELGIMWENKASQDDIMPKEIHLIKDKPTLVRLGALDVLHSFYLPHFRVKMDCVPGLPTSFYFIPTKSTEDMKEILSTQKEWQKINEETGEEEWKSFKYELACTELCGKSHYAMQMDVIVHENEQKFMEWAEAQTPYYESIKATLDQASIEEVEVEENTIAEKSN